MQISPTAGAFNGRGNAFSGIKQYNKAIESFDMAIATNARYASAYNNKGNTLYIM